MKTKITSCGDARVFTADETFDWLASNMTVSSQMLFLCWLNLWFPVDNICISHHLHTNYCIEQGKFLPLSVSKQACIRSYVGVWMVDRCLVGHFTNTHSFLKCFTTSKTFATIQRYCETIPLNMTFTRGTYGWECGGGVGVDHTISSSLKAWDIPCYIQIWQYINNVRFWIRMDNS